MLSAGKGWFFWRFCWGLLALIGVVLLVRGLWLAFLPAPRLAAAAAVLLGRSELQRVFESRLNMTLLLQLRAAAVLATGCWFALLWHTRPNYGGLWYALGLRLRHRLYCERTFFQQQSFLVWLLLGLLVLLYLVSRAYLIASLPLDRDESMSYYYFIKPGPLVAATYYPYPNNHPLYSIFSWPFSWVPLPLIWKIRLPVLLTGLAGIWVFFRLSSRLARSSGAGVVATWCIYCMFTMARYTVYGRGYALSMVLAAGLVLMYQRSLHSKCRLPLGWLAVVQVAGLYTVPTFMYVTLLTMGVYGWYWLWQGRISWWRLVLHVLVVAACTALLYAPFVITSGGWAGFKAAVYSGYNPQALLSFSEGLRFGALEWSILLGLPRFNPMWYALPPLVWLLVLFLGKKTALNAPSLWLLTAFSALPYLVHLMQRQYVPERALGVATLGMGILVVALACTINRPLRRVAMAVLLAVSSVGYTYVYVLGHDAHAWERPKDATANEVAQVLLQLPVDTVYLSDIWYRPAIEAYFHDAGRPLTIFSAQPGSPAYRAFDGPQAYDAILLTPDAMELKRLNLKPFFTRKDAVLYLR